MAPNYPTVRINMTPGKIIKVALLFFIILSILIGISLQGKIIKVQIMIPPALLPFYEWLISFPGINQNLEAPVEEAPPFYKSYLA